MRNKIAKWKGNVLVTYRNTVPLGRIAVQTVLSLHWWEAERKEEGPLLCPQLTEAKTSALRNIRSKIGSSKTPLFHYKSRRLKETKHPLRPAGRGSSSVTALRRGCGDPFLHQTQLF